MVKQLYLLIAAISCLFFSCKKKEKEINVLQPRYEERRELSLSNLYPKEGTHPDTLVLYGNFITENVANVKVFFTNPNLSYTEVSPISIMPTELSVIVPELEHDYRYKLEVYITIDDTTYIGRLDSTFTYDDGRYDNAPNIVPPTTFWPAEVRRGQTITFTGSFYGTPKDHIRIKFAGTSEWQSPVAYDSFDISYLGPVYRVPENATDGPIQVWSSKRFKPTESKDILTLQPSMPPLQRGVWVRQADFAARRRNDEVSRTLVGVASFVINDKLYVVGGHSRAPFDKYGFNSVWEYDPKYNSWIQRAGFPGGRRVNLVGFSIENKGYVGLGEDGNFQLCSDFWEYTPETDTWQRKADFTGSKRVNAVGFSAGGKGYVGSGDDGTKELNDFYSYNPATNSWHEVAPIPGKRTMAYAFVINNNAYVGGGQADDMGLLDMYMYNISTGTWTSKNAIPDYTYTNLNASFSLNGKGYVGLGYDVNRHPKLYSTNQAFEYDPHSDSWRRLPEVGPDSRSCGIGFAAGNAGYFGLGIGIAGFAPHGKLWGYIP